MTTDQLKYFLSVAKHLNFTEANANHRSTDRVPGAYYPDFDAKVKVWDFHKFINRGEFIGYVVGK